MLPAVNYQVISMRNDYYPMGTARGLLQTDLVKEQTRKVLKNRLEKEEITTPIFFGAEAFNILHSVSMRLIPQPERSDKIDVAGLLDAQLAAGNGNGWRYTQMPPDKEAYLSGLHGINETAELMFGKVFVLLEEAKQDEVLTAIQSNVARGKLWEQMPANIFFEELLASLVELYYSHPIAKEEIGEVAYADAKGWQKIGLNELEAHEPLPIKTTGDDE